MPKDAIRRLYNKLFEPGGYRYENLELQGGSPALSTKRPNGGESLCRFTVESITIQEKKADLTAAHFQENVKTILQRMEETDVPPIFLQQCKIQCLAQPASAENALVLLARRLARVYDGVDPFGRPPSLFGVRFSFDPAVLEESTSDKQEDRGDKEDPGDQLVEQHPRRTVKGDFVTVRFDVYPDDPSQVLMSAVASYPQDKPLWLKDAERIAMNIQETYEFLTDKCKRFLDQFDTNDSEID